MVIGSASEAVLAEEADPAYKNTNGMTEVSGKIGIATKADVLSQRL